MKALLSNCQEAADGPEGFQGTRKRKIYQMTSHVSECQGARKRTLFMVLSRKINLNLNTGTSVFNHSLNMTEDSDDQGKLNHRVLLESLLGGIALALMAQQNLRENLGLEIHSMQAKRVPVKPEKESFSEWSMLGLCLQGPAQTGRESNLFISPNSHSE